MSRMTIETKKYRLIERIIDLQDEKLLNQLEQFFDHQLEGGKVLAEITKPMKEKLDIEQLMVEQNYEGFAPEEVEQLIKDIDLQEPIDKLLEI